MEPLVKIPLLAFTILFCAQGVKTQDKPVERNSVQVEWGNNLYGNTISAGYNYRITDHIGAGISFGKGFFSYEIGDNKNFIFAKNTPGIDNIFSLDFGMLLDLKISYRVRGKFAGLKWFDKYEIGLSYVSLTFSDEYIEPGIPGLWKAKKNYSLYSGLASVSIMEYVPSVYKNISFSLGLKSRFTFLKSPQTVFYENGQYSSKVVLSTGDGGSFIWFYPELFLRIGYIF
jgi:hypothetical protein